MHTRTIIDPRYGAKLTGKAGKTTLGVMYANDEAPGYAEDAVAGAAGQTAQTFVDEEHPYLGRDRGWNTFINLRLIPQLESRISIDTNRFVDVYNDALVFDVNIFRTLTTYQFTDRFLLRNISEYNSFDQNLSLNFLFTYRVNAGTVFYAGYDDHYRQADHIMRDLDGNGIDDRIFQSTALKRTNRAVFVKLQHLFRY